MRLKINPWVNTTRKSKEGIKKKPSGIHYPRGYKKREGIEEIKNNSLVNRPQEVI